MLCGGRGSIQACDRALSGPDKRHQLAATEPECLRVYACVRDMVPECLHVCKTLYLEPIPVGPGPLPLPLNLEENSIVPPHPPKKRLLLCGPAPALAASIPSGASWSAQTLPCRNPCSPPIQLARAGQGHSALGPQASPASINANDFSKVLA